MRDVAVLIPTLRRPAMLERALRSVFAQVGSLDRIAAVVVADNDPEGSAAALIDRLRVEAPVPLTYAHAPVPGVATARNVGLAAADAPLIAFLDDDEAASPGWLSALLQAQSQTGADVLFGPIRGRVPEGTGWTTAYLERFFGRDGPTQTRLTDQIHGCGNSLMVRATALPGPAPFDSAMDQTGGEDDQDPDRAPAAGKRELQHRAQVDDVEHAVRDPDDRGHGRAFLHAAGAHFDRAAADERAEAERSKSRLFDAFIPLTLAVFTLGSPA